MMTSSINGAERNRLFLEEGDRVYIRNVVLNYRWDRRYVQEVKNDMPLTVGE
jgi:hypothetical protein